nr:FtsX-like permease family protein [uncultured Lichenicoccus sp.]
MSLRTLARSLGWRLALTIALRDMRGTLSGIRIVLACLALGVAAIGTVGGLRAAIQGGVASQRRAILGGDLSLESPDPLPVGLEPFLRGRHLRLSETVRLRSMLYGPQGRRMLVEVDAVDAAYPLVGEVTLDPARPLAGALPDGLLVEPLIEDRLGVRPGDTLRVGNLALPTAGALAHVPDSAGSASLAPEVMLSRTRLDAAGLIAPGALVTYTLRVALPDDRTQGRARRVQALAHDIARHFPDQPLRIRDVQDAAPALTQVVAQVSQFMTLIGLASLLLGGLGVASGVSAWLQARTEALAVLRCLGASSATVAWIVSLQLGVLCGAGVLAGVVAGLVVPAVAIHELAGLLPVAPDGSVHAGPLLLAAAFGLLVAVLFTLPPLLRAVRVSPVTLFRDDPPERQRQSRGWRLPVVLGALVCVLVLLATLTSPSPWLALGFCAAAGCILLLFRFAGLLLRLGAGFVGRTGMRPAWLGLGVRALHRPGSPASAMLLALGAGLSTLAGIALIEGNIRSAVLGQLPADAPSFYFIDIQPDEAGRFDAVLHALPQAGQVRQLPSLRARVVAVDGVPVAQVHATPQTRWALRGDRGLSLSAAPPPGTHLAAGAWWRADYAGPPLLSFDANLARGWGVHVGSTMTLNVLGRDVVLRVASLRDIAWRSLQLNFAFIASPGMLSAAPHTLVATVGSSGRPADDAAILQAVTDALPNVTGIRVADVLGEIGRLVRRLALALQAMGVLALLSGALVLAATLASGQAARRREAAILRSLGATGRQLRAAWLVEFAVMGAVAGLVAAGIGEILSWLVLHYVLEAPWRLLPETLAATIAGAILLMLLAGLIATRQALRASPAELLRDS